MAILLGICPWSIGAESPTIGLRVTRAMGADDCPEAISLAQLTNDAMHRGTLTADTSDTAVQIEVAFARGPEGLSAAITVIGGDREGVRKLTDAGKTCDDLAQAVVVTLTVMLDEGLPSKPVVNAAKPVAPAPTKDVDRPPPPSAPATSEKRRLALGAELEAGAMFGVVRSAAPYFGVELDAVLGPARLGVGGMAIPPQSHPVADTAGGVVQISLLAAELVACARVLQLGLTEASMCVVGLGGRIQGRSTGLAYDGEAARWWLAGAAGARIEGPLYRSFHWSIRGAALVPRWRQGFEVRHSGIVYEPATIGFSMGMALGATIW